jgi:hypothetical protein
VYDRKIEKTADEELYSSYTLHQIFLEYQIEEAGMIGACSEQWGEMRSAYDILV